MNKANLDGLDISKHLGINMQLLPPVLWMVDNSIPKTNLYPVERNTFCSQLSTR